MKREARSVLNTMAWKCCVVKPFALLFMGVLSVVLYVIYPTWFTFVLLSSKTN